VAASLGLEQGSGGAVAETPNGLSAGMILPIADRQCQRYFLADSRTLKASGFPVATHRVLQLPLYPEVCEPLLQVLKTQLAYHQRAR